jgi:hypothetical protein
LDLGQFLKELPVMEETHKQVQQLKLLQKML